MRIDVSVGLGGMFLSDFMYRHKDSSLDDFISSRSEVGEEKSELIKIDVKILEKGHPDYKNVGLDVDVNFNTLIVNFKPETFAKVLIFIKVPDECKK